MVISTDKSKSSSTASSHHQYADEWKRVRSGPAQTVGIHTNQAGTSLKVADSIPTDIIPIDGVPTLFPK